MLGYSSHRLHGHSGHSDRCYAARLVRCLSAGPHVLPGFRVCHLRRISCSSAIHTSGDLGTNYCQSRTKLPSRPRRACRTTTFRRAETMQISSVRASAAGQVLCRAGKQNLFSERASQGVVCLRQSSQDRRAVLSCHASGGVQNLDLTRKSCLIDSNDAHLMPKTIRETKTRVKMWLRKSAEPDRRRRFYDAGDSPR
jgi:hypothetical protein